MERESAERGRAPGEQDEDVDEDVIAEGDFDLMDEGTGGPGPVADDSGETEDRSWFRRNVRFTRLGLRVGRKSGGSDGA